MNRITDASHGQVAPLQANNLSEVPQLLAAIGEFDKGRLHREVNYYGTEALLRYIYDLPNWISLYFLDIFHSLPAVDRASERIKRNRFKHLFVYGMPQVKTHEQYVKRVYPIGAPFVNYRHKAGIVQSASASGTTVFPSHTSIIARAELDWVAFAEEVANLPTVFHPVRVCLFYLDIELGRAQPFLERGIPVVTAGHKLDFNFPVRFYQIVSQSRWVAGNHIGSFAYYAIEMGIPFFFLGPEASYIFYTERNDMGGKVGEEFKLKSQVYTPSAFEEELKLFTPPFAPDGTPILRPETRAYVLDRLGIPPVVSRATVRRLILIEWLKYQSLMPARRLLKTIRRR